MRQLATYLLLLLLSAAAWQGCERTVAEPMPDGYEYFPLSVGRYWVYQIDSTIFDPSASGTQIDTLRRWVREEIVDTLLSLDGEVLYRVERTLRLADTLPWQIDKILALSRDGQRAYRLEDNLRTVDMVFPIRVQQRWTPTVFLDENLSVSIAGEPVQVFKGWRAVTLAIDEVRQVGNQTFTDVLSLRLADFENLLEYRFATAQYAPGTGLIYRELWAVDTQCQVCCNGNFGTCEGLPWMAKAERGFVLRQTLVEHGE